MHNKCFILLFASRCFPWSFLLEFLTVGNKDIGGTWRDRLAAWKVVLQKEKLAEQLDLNSKYVVEFDMKEVENSLQKDVVEKAQNTQGTRALWISKRWWRYRPKLPYTYFLQKLDSSEVQMIPFFNFFLRHFFSSMLYIFFYQVQDRFLKCMICTVVSQFVNVLSSSWFIISGC